MVGAVGEVGVGKRPSGLQHLHHPQSTPTRMSRGRNSPCHGDGPHPILSLSLLCMDMGELSPWGLLGVQALRPCSVIQLSVL